MASLHVTLEKYLLEKEVVLTMREMQLLSNKVPMARARGNEEPECLLGFGYTCRVTMGLEAADVPRGEQFSHSFIQQICTVRLPRARHCALDTEVNGTGFGKLAVCIAASKQLP
jgi:hypothetical protein